MMALLNISCSYYNAHYCERQEDTNTAIEIIIGHGWHILEGIVTLASLAVTALATWFVATYTRKLNVSTRKLWLAGEHQTRIGEDTAKATMSAAQAARDSADTLPALERAYILLEMVAANTRNIDRIIDLIAKGKIVNRKFETGADGYPIIEFTFKNYGRTPAIIKDISYKFDHWSIETTPAYIHREDIRSESALGFNESTAIKRTGVLLPISKEAAEAILARKSFLWFYGRIVYDDVFGREHETTFWWRYGGPSIGLGQWGGPEWNKRT